MIARCTPRAVWSVLVAAFCAALIQRTGVLLGYWKQSYNPNTPFALLMVVAYAVSLVLCLNIAADHRSSPAMRNAWFLFAGSSALSILRHLTQAAVASGLFPGLGREASYIPVQVPMALALIHPLRFLETPAVWVGLAVSGAFVAGAVYCRRRSENRG